MSYWTWWTIAGYAGVGAYLLLVILWDALRIGEDSR